MPLELGRTLHASRVTARCEALRKALRKPGVVTATHLLDRRLESLEVVSTKLVSE